MSCPELDPEPISMTDQTLTMANNSILSDAFKSDPYPTFRW